MVEEGLEAFSVNRVAAKADITIGNLQYYFPARKDLLYGLLESQIVPAQEYLQAMEVLPRRDRDTLREILRYVLDLNTLDDACAVAWSTVMVALHDEDIKLLADTWFTSYRRGLMQALALYEPSLSKQQLESLSLTIMSLLEGNALVWRHTVPGPRQRAAAQKGFD